MKHQRSVHSVARVIAFVALNLVMIASVGAQRQEREATVAGRDVTIQVTVQPHNDRARAAAAQFQADDFTVCKRSGRWIISASAICAFIPR
jgi:tRNA(Leu) C34 or U34 (ribose-2'-O)-methylase TrmL